MIPSRFTNVAEARARYGDAVDQLAPFLLHSDPLADAVIDTVEALPGREGWAMFTHALAHGIDAVPNAPASFQALFAQVDTVPSWADFNVIDRGGRLLLRAGFFSGVVLGVESLVYGYCSPAGNKPLALSGRLREQTPRRLSETGRFVQATCLPGGMHRYGDGFAITLRVRLVHARVRKLARASGRWNQGAWGEPINQHDMAATTLLFSMGVVDGLRKFGFRPTRREVDDFLLLWRYSGYLIGVDAKLLPTSEAAAERLWGLIALTEGDPDDDSRALARALFESPLDQARTPRARAVAERYVRLTYGFCRGLIGATMADKLDVPATRLDRVVPALRNVIMPIDTLRRYVPLLDRASLAAGTRYWNWVVTQGLAGTAAEFAPHEATLTKSRPTDRAS